MKLSEHPQPRSGMVVRSDLSGKEGKITDVTSGMHGNKHYARIIKIRWKGMLTDSIAPQHELDKVEVVE